MNKSAVDKTYYYRGDASFLGLFNDAPNPRDTSSKAFCTYAAQAFGLYKQMFGTPQLLATPELSGNDIYVLAGRGTNAVNVLISNFTPDLRLAAGAKTPSGGLNQQHYVDSGRLLFAIDDDWSIKHWFGGSKPSLLRQTQYHPPSHDAHQDAPETDEDGADPVASSPLWIRPRPPPSWPSMMVSS